jgi:hypothetical protein
VGLKGCSDGYSANAVEQTSDLERSRTDATRLLGDLVDDNYMKLSPGMKTF